MTSEMSPSEAITKIWDLIRDVRIAMLTTVGDDGELRSRPMATQEDKFDGSLRFLTSWQSHKVNEIEHGSPVGLTYVNNDARAFISLSGRADLNRDRELIRQLWKPQHAIWFPQGKDDPDIAVIQVTVEEAEYWETPGNVLVRSFHMLKAAVTNDRSNLGLHEKVAL